MHQAPLELLFQGLNKPSSLSLSSQPLLDWLVGVHVSLTLRSPEMDPALQRSHTSAEWRGRITSLYLQLGNTLPHSAQDAVGLICCKDTGLAHVQFFHPRILRSSSAKLLSSQWTPSLHCDRELFASSCFPFVFTEFYDVSATPYHWAIEICLNSPATPSWPQSFHHRKQPVWPDTICSC